ncbi:nucleolar protein of 40 kDa [Megalops cyprinoides]|uniref:nucleolar protein of 40 kDa n=1 Tax=Megalops cyprinoides TaxID=118141 RepID=UPI001863C12D|nr:nucleolar protein of 40 kDa [Megalops cyprinoides]
MDGYRGREPVNLEELPQLYSIIRGEVASVTAYGAFVKIPGCRKQGLVHKSEMSSCRVDNPSEIVDVGEQVWVKVIGREIQEEKVKLSFSMKAVNQGTGKDLDPNNVMLEQDERRRRQFRDHTSRRITLEAVLNTTCKKCGCKGHFAKDCFSQPGLQYSLVPDEEEEGEQEPASLATQQPHKRKKEKKSKKKKKKKEKKQSSSDSDSSDSDEDPGPAKRGRSSSEAGSREEKKKKKHKKQKHKSHRKRE